MADQNKSNDPYRVPDTKAVAVKRKSEDAAPVITAKGHGYNAEKILDIAFAEGVKVRQDKDLTELLDAFDVDCPVPLEALHAVSLILERVNAENQRLREIKDRGDTSRSQDTIDTSDELTAQPMADHELKDQDE